MIIMNDYDSLDIYSAGFDEVKKAVRKQYREREWCDCYGREMTVKDWYGINRELKDDLKRMNVRNAGVFYNPNNMRVYIKQTFRKVKYRFEDGEVEEFTISSSEDYEVATGRDYCTDEEYFTVPAW